MSVKILKGHKYQMSVQTQGTPKIPCQKTRTWFTIKTVLVLSIINRWSTRQVDFVLAFPQANIKFNIYMEIP